MRVEHQRAYIIHTRAFRDTSLLVDCYTQEHGRLSLIAKGARARKNKNRSLLQPFQLLSISWQGRGNLKTLIDTESLSPPTLLKSHFLYSGLYVNELFLYLLPAEDAADDLFDRYHDFLAQLQEQKSLEPTLRQFELTLLETLGYGIDFSADAHTSEPINLGKKYHYFVGQGFIDADISALKGAMLFDGEAITKIAEGNFLDQQTLRQAKMITRLSIDSLLDGKTLKSREFFKQIAAQAKSVE